MPSPAADPIETDIEVLNSAIESLKTRIAEAAQLGFELGCIDGGHHKMWAIDQMLRKLLGDEYDAWVAEWSDSGDDSDDFEWDVGIAP